ncbi:uncharacterized protein DS421_18g621130 [Arachis hypogaea]|nr:uncharacterized protein DS421_18g621130 [Arachis hypogaea]
MHHAIWAFSQTHSMHDEETIENNDLNMQATLFKKYYIIAKQFCNNPQAYNER